ncbi:MAG TPA: hypothetical protein PK011_18770, partial [Marinagarivorans sp.]|nr:hypothetical protein [Marinagarivorans sp.]
IGADEQPGGYSDQEYWGGMLTALQADPDNTVSVIKEGEYHNQDGSLLNYKIFKLQMGEVILH